MTEIFGVPAQALFGQLLIGIKARSMRRIEEDYARCAQYRRYIVDALSAEDVDAHSRSLVIDESVSFLQTLVRQFPVLNFAQRNTGCIYARFEKGKLA